MNTAKLYDFMQQLIEHKRMEENLHELIIAEMSVKVGDVEGRSMLSGQRQVISIVPVLTNTGMPARWVMEAEITYRTLRRDGSYSTKPPIVTRRPLVVDWMCQLPKASEPRATVADMVASQAVAEKALVACLDNVRGPGMDPTSKVTPAQVTAFEQMVQPLHGLGHGKVLVERRAQNRPKGPYKSKSVDK